MVIFPEIILQLEDTIIKTNIQILMVTVLATALFACRGGTGGGTSGLLGGNPFSG